MSDRVRATRRGVACLAVLALIAVACGNRLPHEEIVAAAQGGAVQGAVSGGETAPALPAEGMGATGGAETSGAAPAAAPGTAAQAPGGPGRTAQTPQTGGGAAPSLPPLVIGNVGNYSGPAGSSQAPCGRAVQVWAQWVNDRGGVAGHPVKVFVADDGGDPARHQSVVQDLVENRKVIAFVGNCASLTHAAGRKYLEEKRIPVIGGEISVGLWYESPMFFPQGTLYRTLIFGMALTGKRLGGGKTKLGVLTCQEAEVCVNVDRWLWDEGLARKAGLEPVYRGKGTLEQPDYTAECISARNQGTELFSLTFDPNSVSRIIASCARQGFNPIYLQHSATVDQRTPTAGGSSPDVRLVTLTFPWVASDTPATKEFQQAMAHFGVAPNAATSMGWASAKLFERAARNVGDVPKASALLEGLWSLRGETIGGLTPPLTFRRGKPAVDPGCWFVVRADAGRWTAPQGSKLSCV